MSQPEARLGSSSGRVNPTVQVQGKKCEELMSDRKLRLGFGEIEPDYTIGN